MVLGEQSVARQPGDDLGAEISRPCPPTASMNTVQIWMSIHSIKREKWGNNFHMPLVLLRTQAHVEARLCVKLSHLEDLAVAQT